jgi:ribokinase
VPAAALSILCEVARSNGVPLFLDPTPPEQIDRSLLEASDVITPDLAEAAQLTGRVDGSQVWPSLAARELVSAGASRVIVKIGERGSLIAEPDVVVQVPTLRVDVLDETGAGDVFMAALGFWRMKGADWRIATRFANAASALSVSRLGLALPARSEVVAAAQDISPGVAEVSRS